jgi:drug/metabolite transporter (DMT)-like permease
MQGLLAMIAIGIVGWFALYALDRALEAAPAAILAPVLYTELVWDLLLHWRPDVTLGRRTDLGAILIIVATFATLVWWRGRHTMTAERATA